MSVRFAWYDLWVGAYIDRKARTLYVCPLPCVLFTFRRTKPPGSLTSGAAVERTQE